MKILLIGELSWSYVAGSSTQKVQQNIFRELKKNNQNVHFFEITLSDSLVKKLFRKIIISENGVITGGLIRLCCKILKSNYDLVHLLVLRNYMLLLFPLILFGTKLVIVVHDTLSIRGLIPKNLNHLLRIFFIKFAHGVFVFNQSDRKLLTRYRKDYTTIFVVKQGIKLDSFSLKNNLDIVQGTILFFGGVGKEYKGLKFLRSALLHVKTEHKLLIYGPNYSGENDRDYYGVLKETEYNVILNQSRMVVVPSIYESFSLVALEAIACGIPVILTKSCGITDYLVDGGGCWIVDYGNIEYLTEKIEQLLTDESMWIRMSDEAIRVAKDFDWSKIIPNYISIYHLVLDEKK